jgi:hypothetical protein
LIWFPAGIQLFRKGSSTATTAARNPAGLYLHFLEIAHGWLKLSKFITAEKRSRSN